MHSTQLDAAIAKVVAEVRDGLKHGFFEYRIRGEIISGHKRQLILEAGKSFKFTIPEEDLKSVSDCNESR